MNFLIETKQEYTIHLVNSINQLVYEGLQNIYEEAKNNAKNNDELKIFQILLSNVPKWNPDIINNEYQRIIRLNNLGKTIEDLLKAVIKSNIVVLTNTNVDYNDKLLQELNIQDDFKNFIHLVYIECARSFYNTPFLFSHRESPLEIKRNQTEILKIIQDCIKNAIRKMIPLQITIKTYLEKNNKVATDLKSESNQIKNMLKSEKMRRTDATPSSPRELHSVLASTVRSEDMNGVKLLKNNNKTLDFSEKTLRDSILNQDMSEVKPKANLNNLNSIVKNNFSNLSESSVYYEPGKHNLIEEYSNKNGLEPLTEKSERSEQNEKYYSNLNV
jgi:hypothetical protein